MNLTITAVENLKYCKSGNRADLYFDDKLQGFGVRVYPSGEKAFFIDYRNASGEKKRFTLGRWGRMTLDEARKLARRKLAGVDEGHDPSIQRREQRAEQTLKEYSVSYFEQFEPRKRGIKYDKQRWRDYIEPALGSRKLSAITPQDCEKLHRGVKEELSPSTANRVAALLKHMLNVAVKSRILGRSPADALAMYKEPPPRDIMLTPSECQAILEACRNEANQAAANLIALCLWTGRRVGELRVAKWSDLDIENRRLTLPQTKAGERQFVILGDEAVAILNGVVPVADNPFIFAGSATGKPLNGYFKAWRRILTQADIKPFPVHGLRHNYASLLVQQGIPLTTVGALLGHKTSVTTLKYAHHRPEQLLAATQTLGTVISLDERRTKKAGIG